MRKVDSRLIMVVALVIGTGIGLIEPARVAYAATITVTTTADELDTNGACSLREAIRAANLNRPVGACVAGSTSGTDTITVPAGTYVLTRAGADEEEAVTGDLDVTGALKITGAGASKTYIDGNALDRVINVKTGAKLTLTNVTVRNGNAGSASTSVNGGGIYNSGTLTLSNSTVSGNEAQQNGAGIYNNGILTLTSVTVSDNYAWASGGGIYNAASRRATVTKSTIRNNLAEATGGGIETVGTLKLSSSTVSANTSHHGGGGIVAIDGGTAEVVASTLSRNDAEESGGGLVVYRGGAATLINSTVSGNIGGGGDPEEIGWGGGVDNTGGSLSLYGSTVTLNVGGTGGLVGPATLANTIVAGNTRLFSEEPSDCTGTVTSQGYNLIGNTNGCSISGDITGNLLNVAANLGPLQKNGGPTFTHALQPGSRAIDAGNPATPGSTATTCATKDQRNVVRPRDGNGDGVARCDIGAVERKSASTP